MKKFNKELGLATTLIMLSLYCLFITGCSTITQPNNVVIEQAIITGASQEGTILTLTTYPQYRPAIQLADGVLFDVANSTNLSVTPSDIDFILQSNHLTNEAVLTLIDNSLILVNHVNINLGTNANAITDFKVGVSWVATGVSNGLSITK